MKRWRSLLINHIKILNLRNTLAKIKTVICKLTTEIDTKKLIVKPKVKRKYSDRCILDKRMENIGGGGM